MPPKQSQQTQQTQQSQQVTTTPGLTASERIQAKLKLLPPPKATTSRVIGGVVGILVSWLCIVLISSFFESWIIRGLLFPFVAVIGLLSIAILVVNILTVIKRWWLERSLRKLTSAKTNNDVSLSSSSSSSSFQQKQQQTNLSAALKREQVIGGAGARADILARTAYTDDTATGSSLSASLLSTSKAAATATTTSSSTSSMFSHFDALSASRVGGGDHHHHPHHPPTTTTTPSRVGRGRAGSSGALDAAVASLAASSAMKRQQQQQRRTTAAAATTMSHTNNFLNIATGFDQYQPYDDDDAYNFSSSNATSRTGLRSRVGGGSGVTTTSFVASTGWLGGGVLRAQELGLDEHALHGVLNPDGSVMKAATSHIDRGFEVDRMIKQGSEEERGILLEDDMRRQKVNTTNAPYHIAESEHPPGELLPATALPRHVHIGGKDTLRPGGDLPALEPLAEAMKLYIANHIKNVYLVYVKQNADDLVKACKRIVPSKNEPLKDPPFDIKFLLRAREVPPSVAKGFALSISRFGVEGIDRSQGLATEFPLRKSTMPGHPVGHLMTLDDIVAEQAWKKESNDFWRAEQRSASYGLGIARPGGGGVGRSANNAILFDDQLRLWHEKACLEAFLWAGPGFTTSAAVTAASRGVGGLGEGGGGRSGARYGGGFGSSSSLSLSAANSGEAVAGGGAFDVKAYVLDRLAKLASTDMKDYKGDVVPYGNGLGRFMSSPDPALALLPTDAQIIWHYAITLMDALVADAAIHPPKNPRNPAFKVNNERPSVLNQVFNNVYVDVGGLGIGLGPGSGNPNTGSSSSGGGVGVGGDFLGAPSGPGYFPTTTLTGAAALSSKAPFMQQSIRFKLHCIEETPRMKVATTVDGFPVQASSSSSRGGGGGGGGGGGSGGFLSIASSAKALAAEADSVPRTLALFAYLQWREAKGVLWVHRDASVDLEAELKRMCTPA